MAIREWKDVENAIADIERVASRGDQRAAGNLLMATLAELSIRRSVHQNCHIVESAFNGERKQLLVGLDDHDADLFRVFLDSMRDAASKALNNAGEDFENEFQQSLQNPGWKHFRLSALKFVQKY